MTTNYQKLTLESFMERLQSGVFKDSGVAGARRSIGKASFSKADREKANLAINKHFGVDASAPKQAKKSAPKKAAKAPKTAAAPKKVTRQPVVSASVRRTPVPTPTEALEAAARAYTSPSPDERAVRANAAATIVTTLFGHTPIDPELQRQLLSVAGHDYLEQIGMLSRPERPSPEDRAGSESATPAVKSNERIARPRIPNKKAEKAAAPAAPPPAPAVVNPAETAADAVPENGVAEPMTAEQIAQYEKLGELKKAAEAQD